MGHERARAVFSDINKLSTLPGGESVLEAGVHGVVTMVLIWCDTTDCTRWSRSSAVHPLSGGGVETRVRSTFMVTVLPLLANI